MILRFSRRTNRIISATLGKHRRRDGSGVDAIYSETTVHAGQMTCYGGESRRVVDGCLPMAPKKKGVTGPELVVHARQRRHQVCVLKDILDVRCTLDASTRPARAHTFVAGVPHRIAHFLSCIFQHTLRLNQQDSGLLLCGRNPTQLEIADLSCLMQAP